MGELPPTTASVQTRLTFVVMTGYGTALGLRLLDPHRMAPSSLMSSAVLRRIDVLRPRGPEDSSHDALRSSPSDGFRAE